MAGNTKVEYGYRIIYAKGRYLTDSEREANTFGPVDEDYVDRILSRDNGDWLFESVTRVVVTGDWESNE